MSLASDTGIATSAIAIVTGAGSGIGRAVALRLARDNYVVGSIDLDEEGAAATAAAIREGGGRSTFARADVTDSAMLANAVRYIVGEAETLEIVVSAAGIARGGYVHKMSEDIWDQVIAVNLKGTFLLAKHTVPLMLRSNGGAFVAISSDAGIMGAVGYGAYCASKHGVIGLVRTMALDYGARGIRSNVVCPGFVETPMAEKIFAGAPDGTMQAFEKSVPLGRFGRPQEIADAVAHLASADASYANGMVYVLDGGGSAGHYIGQARTAMI